MHNQYKNLFIILIVIINGCEQRSEYMMAIVNNTSDTINIFFTGNSATTQGTENIVALPNQETNYYNAEGWTVKEKNMECDPQINSDEVTIVTSSERNLLKNIWNKEEWYCETDENNSYWKMIFRIEEEDLE